MTTGNSRDLDRLAALLDVHGANIADWPDADRPALEQLLARSKKAQALMAEAQALDGLLAQVPSPNLPAGAVSRLMAKTPQSASVAPWRRIAAWLAPAQGAVMPGSVLAASLMLGIAMGLGGYLDEVLPQDSVVLAALDDTDDIEPGDVVLRIDFSEDL